MSLTITLLVVAGTEIDEHRGPLGIIQNLTVQQAGAIADWIALATDKPVHVRHLELGGEVVDIHRANAASVAVKIVGEKHAQGTHE